MHKRTAVLLLVAVCVIAVLAFVALQSVGLAPQTTSFFTTSTSTSTSTTSTTLPTTAPTTTVAGYQGCLAPGVTVPLKNGAFATGTYANWTVDGAGFGAIPQNITYDNKNNDYYSQPWTGYLGGTYFASTYHGGLILQAGNLTSQQFEVTEPYLNFQIVSPQNENLYVEVLKNGQPAIRSYYNTFGASGNNASTFFNASIPMATLLCSNASVRIVASLVGGTNTAYYYIAVGGFYQSRTPVQTPGVLVNQVILNQS